MDLSINSDMSFRANIVTPLKGRNNILEPVAKEFSRLTKNIDGTFSIDRADTIIAPRKDHVLELQTGRANILTRELHDFLSVPPEKADKKTIKAIAKQLVSIFKALRRQDKYITSCDKPLQEMQTANSSVRRLSKMIKEARESGYDKYAEILSATLEKYQRSADAAEAKIEKAYERTLKSMEKDDNVISELLYMCVPEPKDLHLYG